MKSGIFIKLFTILFIVLSFFSHSMTTFAINISGIVMESETLEPLAYANIFLAETD